MGAISGVRKKFGIKNNFSSTPPSNLNYDWSLIPVNLCAPAPFPYATPLSPFILPHVSFVSVIRFACAFISVYASHIFPFHYLI